MDKIVTFVKETAILFIFCFSFDNDESHFDAYNGNEQIVSTYEYVIELEPLWRIETYPKLDRINTQRQFEWHMFPKMYFLSCKHLKMNHFCHIRVDWSERQRMCDTYTIISSSFWAQTFI